MGNKLPVEIKGLGKSLLLAMVSGIILASAVYFTNLSETLLGPMGKIVLILSIFWGGCYISKSYGSKGLIRGMNLGLMFFIIILISTLLFNPSLLSFKMGIYSLLLCIVSGGLGGILGIGLSNF